MGVEFDRQGGWFQLLHVQYYLEDILGRPVDLGTLDSVKEHLRKPVLKDIIHAF
jgi:predicted nucleotidyltransferase